MIIVGIAGSSASGKTSVCQEIVRRLGDENVEIVCLDWFYKEATNEDWNWDDPNNFDWIDVVRVFAELCNGMDATAPGHDFITHKRIDGAHTVYPKKIVILEGIFALWEPTVRSYMNLKIYIYCDEARALIRRIRRDLSTRGRTLDSVDTQYFRDVQPALHQHIVPTQDHAHLMINNSHQIDIKQNVGIKGICDMLENWKLSNQDE
jgi:uridine kinase